MLPDLRRPERHSRLARLLDLVLGPRFKERVDVTWDGRRMRVPVSLSVRRRHASSLTTSMLKRLERVVGAVLRLHLAILDAEIIAETTGADGATDDARPRFVGPPAEGGRDAESR